MSRFFVEPEAIKEGIVSIGGSEAKHIFNSLRLGVGDVISVFDGSGEEYIALIEKASAENIKARVIEEKSVNVEPFCRITLFQGFPKAQKMDFVVEKCTEIGVSRIVPLITERTVIEIDKDDQNKRSKRIGRWQRIAQAASKQSGRRKIPEIAQPMLFNEAINEEMDISFIPWEMERKKNLKKIFSEKREEKIDKIGIFIGPEGGFTKEEIGRAVHKKIIPITLGPRILRCETAGMVTAALILHELESDRK